jgi:hypothetical protein
MSSSQPWSIPDSRCAPISWSNSSYSSSGRGASALLPSLLHVSVSNSPGRDGLDSLAKSANAPNMSTQSRCFERGMGAHESPTIRKWLPSYVGQGLTRMASVTVCPHGNALHCKRFGFGMSCKSRTQSLMAKRKSTSGCSRDTRL